MNLFLFEVWREALNEVFDLLDAGPAIIIDITGIEDLKIGYVFPLKG
jgi:hypothetical protein